MSQMVREEFIRQAECHMQVRPPGAINFRALADTSPLQFCRVCDSNTRRGEGMGSLKRGRAAPQRQRFRQGSKPRVAGGPLALDALPSLDSALNTVLILPDGDEEIMRGMFERFKWWAGGILRVGILFPGASVVIQDAMSDKQ